MSLHDVHLVGSIPLQNASDVFEKVSAVLGPALHSIPDGETGDRISWLNWLEAVFRDHPDFEPSEQKAVDARGGDAKQLYRLKAGVRPENVMLDTLRHAQVHLASYHAQVAGIA